MKHIIKFSILTVVLSIIGIVGNKLFTSLTYMYILACGFIGFLCVTMFLMYGAVKDKYDSSSPRYMKSLIPYVGIVSFGIMLLSFILVSRGEYYVIFNWEIIFLIYFPSLLFAVLECVIISQAYVGIKGPFSKTLNYFSKHPFAGLAIIFAWGIGCYFLLCLFELNPVLEVFVTLSGIVPSESTAIWVIAFLCAGVGYYLIRRSDRKLSFAFKYFLIFMGSIAVLLSVYMFLPAESYNIINSGFLWITDAKQRMSAVILLLFALPLVTVSTSLLLGALSGRKKERRA